MTLKDMLTASLGELVTVCLLPAAAITPARVALLRHCMYVIRQDLFG